MYREYLLTVYESGFDRISTFMFSVNIRAGPWYVRALRHESDCGPLIHIFANCSIDLVLVLFLLLPSLLRNVVYVKKQLCYLLFVISWLVSRGGNCGRPAGRIEMPLCKNFRRPQIFL